MGLAGADPGRPDRPGAASDASRSARTTIRRRKRPCRAGGRPFLAGRIRAAHLGRRGPRGRPFADRSQSGWAIAAILFLAGAAFGLLRLGGGLWAVFDLRRRSRLILDEATLRLMRQLREEIDCRSPVELRECPGLGAPAAAGWLRPLVLLPADWRDWGEDELRAALAHELAHVRRSDFLLGLLARLGLAVHFYHPLLYWLAGRLRLHRSWPPTASPPRSLGGRDAYLRGLARLACGSAIVVRRVGRPTRSFPAACS